MKRIRDIAARANGFRVGILFVTIYALLRTTAVDDWIVFVWAAAAIAATLLSPLAGLTVLAALGPFTEALTDDGRVTVMPFLLAALGISVAGRLLMGRIMPRLSLPLVLAALILAGTALGVAVSALNYGLALGIAAGQGWVVGIGGALTTLLAAAWLALRGDVRPMLVTVAAVALGAVLVVGNEMMAGELRNSAIGWLLRTDIDPQRVGGLFPAPNAVAALFATSIAVCLAVALSGARPPIALAAAGAAAVQLVALVLTFSRSGLIALGVVVALVLWRRWRRLAPLLAAAVVVATIAVLGFAWLVRGVSLSMEENRLEAWAAALRMWLANPVLGAGFRSFEWLHEQYGSPVVDAPHNEWLRLLAEEGTIIGLAGVAFAVATPLILLRSPNILVVGTGAAAAGLFIAACFNNPFLSVQANVSSFMIIGAGLGLAARAAGSAAAQADDDRDRARQWDQGDRGQQIDDG